MEAEAKDGLYMQSKIVALNIYHITSKPINVCIACLFF
jgi:hypothetical protein